MRAARSRRLKGDGVITVISRDTKRLEKRAADHIRTFEKIADRQKHVRVEVDAEKREYEYA
jgi:hypothetical protein